MSEQLIGECLCVPLVVDLPGVLAAWSLDECPSCLARVNDRRVSHQNDELVSVHERAENAAQGNLVALKGISAGREGDR
jgi:hypothetical protein